MKLLWMTAMAAGLTGLVACSSGDTSVSGGGTNSNLSLFDHTNLNYREATPEECAGGGGVYSLYIDANVNGTLDVTETVLHVQKVCNGQNGLATLFLMAPVLETDLCASGSGLQISFGLDADRDGALAPSEVSSTQILCNGANGQQGSAGAPGAGGMNAVFQVVAAPPQVCPNGGSTFLMALDALGTGVYSALDPNQQSATVCNGVNGQDGQDAAISSYSIMEPISPCGNTASYKEVLLLLANGQVLASFSAKENGQDTRLAFLTDGSYVDTDGTNCAFQISTSPDGQTRYMSWGGKVQKTWSVAR